MLAVWEHNDRSPFGHRSARQAGRETGTFQLASTRGLPLSAIPSREWKIKQPPPRGSNRIYITVLLMQFLSDFTSVRLVKAQARSVSAVRWQRECEPPRTRGAVWMAASSLETMETRAATIARHKKHTPRVMNVDTEECNVGKSGA